MYLKKLELIGFKSFFNKTTLHFEPGITAVVGPNGCGKSNIFDSIRWVLGEQSVKSLRGSDMQDVIFNGTDSKEALSMAEVSLTFDNSHKFFNYDDSEVVISRRLFRSGESEYLLNKNVARLKDILDLLMGTGIGAESYSLVAQGKIDLVLSSRPEERRLVFDEASGITKYKTQKREALRKLEETEQNLLRVNDIIVEVKRQIGSLERQAQKARRYKEVFEELKLKEMHLALLQKAQLIRDKDEVILLLGELEAKEIKLMEAIKEQESRISNRQNEIKNLETALLGLKNTIMNLENTIVRNKERIGFNGEKISELFTTKASLETQTGQVKLKIEQDEEKLQAFQSAFDGIRKQLEEKSCIIRQEEEKLQSFVSSIRASHDNISKAKNSILDLVARIAATNNEISDLTARQQTFFARRKRLELEKAKVREERSAVEENLAVIEDELNSLNADYEKLNNEAADAKNKCDNENACLQGLLLNLQELEKQLVGFQSYREFVEKLKTTYEGIGESFNATVYLDKLPETDLSGLVLKITQCQRENLKLLGEAKPMDLDTSAIAEKISALKQEIETRLGEKNLAESRKAQLEMSLAALQQELRQQDIILANKKTVYEGVRQQSEKLREEENIIDLELSDLEKELNDVDTKLSSSRIVMSQLQSEQSRCEEILTVEQDSIAQVSASKEQVLVSMAQRKTEIEDLTRRLHSDEQTLRLLEGTFDADKQSLENMERQMQDCDSKTGKLRAEIEESEKQMLEASADLEGKRAALQEREREYERISVTANEVLSSIDSDRKQYDALRNRLHELQMRNKDIDFKFQTIKERMLQGYNINIEITDNIVPEGSCCDVLAQEVQRLKEKVESYGNVNLVAIEEYDELKKRYDFLTQQQTDLNAAKESLREALLKINRTTRKMFMETFELVKTEFRNYFRLLFNGGDAQLFLTDEQDPLECGIEIICRPPGKKLQNVLLLSGGEKSLSAIALIFAIFKVKPSPFCILDEIDAALDEANVDRFGRLLQEFIKTSQFIVITHNKRTIANADVMYGITMEESGVSKIVSVKFAKEGPKQDSRPQTAEPAPV